MELTLTQERDDAYEMVQRATDAVCAHRCKVDRIYTVDIHRKSWARYWTYRGILESTRIALEAS